MSEAAPLSPETSKAEQHGEKGHEHHAVHRHEAAPESSKERSEKLEHIRSEVSHEATHKTEIPKFDEETETDRSSAKPPINKELKNITLNKELKHIRTKLSAPDKLGSRFIHIPLVRSISEVSSKTISRPSGLLGGGLVAFIGSGLYFYLTKHVGLRYNYAVFTVLFVGGFIIGLALELGIYTLRSSKKSLK